MQKLLGATFSGVFWLIDNSSSKFVGLLDIDENGSAILKVEGDGPELMALDNRQKFHMHGNAEGQEITLFDCFATWVPLIPAQRKATIAANIVTIGALVDSLDQKLASALSFTTPEIIYWTRLRGLAIKSGKKGIGATYRSKKTREVQVAGATFQFGTSIRYTTRSVSELDYLEQHSVRIVFSEPQSVVSADRWVTRTCRLMELALRCPIKCSVFMLEREASRHFSVVTHWSSSVVDEKIPLPLFTRPKKQAVYAKILRSWFAKYDKLEPVISLRAALLSHPTRYREFEFLTYVQALEALHRRTRPSRTIVKAERFSALRRKLVAAIPDRWKAKSAFVDRLAYLNEISLAARLKDIFAGDNQLIEKLFPGGPKDIALIKDIRNYLTHYEGRKRRDIKAYTETVKFWYFTSKVGLLLEIAILRAIGFSRTDVRKIIEPSSTYRNLCKINHSL